VRVHVGATYQKTLDWPMGTVVVFVVLAEVTALTCRFKKQEPGYRFLVLEVDGPTNDIMDYAPGQIKDYVAGAHFFTKLRQIGSLPAQRVR